MRRLRSFLDLPAGQRRRLIAAAAAVTWCALLLEVRGYSRARAFLGRRSVIDRLPPRLDTASWVDSQAEAMRRATAALPWATCLRRSLALWWLLRRRGIRSEIRFGGRLGDDPEGELEAHAWVELGGRVLTDAGDPEGDYELLEAGRAGR